MILLFDPGEFQGSPSVGQPADARYDAPRFSSLLDLTAGHWKQVVKSWGSRARNDRQHEPRPAIFRKVQCVYAAEDVSRPIARLVVRERTNPAQRIGYMRRDHRRAAIFIIV